MSSFDHFRQPNQVSTPSACSKAAVSSAISSMEYGTSDWSVCPTPSDHIVLFDTDRSRLQTFIHSGDWQFTAHQARVKLRVKFKDLSPVIQRHID